MTEKRSSSRITVLSKSMRTVDDATRREVKDKRLRALEADNYNEEAVVEVSHEDNYSSEESADDEPVSKRRRAKPKAKAKAKTKVLIKQQRMTRVRDLDRIMDSQKQQLQKSLLRSNGDDEAEVICNYVSVEAPNSSLPGRKFCSVCGYSSKYSCTRCGMRYCSIRCNNSHKETRCLKFSIM